MWFRNTSRPTCACSTPARSRRRRTRRHASASGGCAGSIPARISCSPAAASMRIPAHTRPSTRSSRTTTRTASPSTSSRCRAPTTIARDAPFMRSRAFVKVQDGCDHRCTYCIVWQARGASSSIPARTVHDRVRAAIDAGHAEIVLCGVDLGSYGRDIGTDLANTRRVAARTRAASTARIRLSSINANDVSPGDDRAQRAPTALLALAHAAAERERPDPSRHAPWLPARAIPACGARVARHGSAAPSSRPTSWSAFPGETEDDHAETLSLVDEVGFLQGHVFRWSPRPGTPASALDRPRGRRRRSAAQRRGAPRDQTLRRALARRQRAGACTRSRGTPSRRHSAHGLTAGYHEITVDGRGRRPPGRSGPRSRRRPSRATVCAVPCCAHERLHLLRHRGPRAPGHVRPRGRPGAGDSRRQPAGAGARARAAPGAHRVGGGAHPGPGRPVGADAPCRPVHR